MFMTPRVTVLMPAHNAGKYIAQSIQSVLDQTYQDWELLIVNDGSTDNTLEVVRSFNDPRIRLHENSENLGLIKTLNRGLGEAKGELIARLDSDDLASPDRLQLQVSYMQKHLDCALVGTRSRTIDSSGGVISARTNLYRHAETNEGIAWESVFFNPIRHSSATFRKSCVWDKLGGYPVNAKHMEDFALWSSVLDHAKVANLPEYTCDYRVHQASVMSKAKESAKVKLEDPRRQCAEKIFFGNAIRCGMSEALASRWASLWPLVQYPLDSDRPQMTEVRRVFCEIIKCRPRYFDAIRQDEVVRVIARGVFKLSKRLRSHKCYGDLVLLYLSTMLTCNWVLCRAYLSAIRNKFKG